MISVPLVSTCISSLLARYILMCTSYLPAFLTPANAMLSVELGHLADILDAAGQSKNISTKAKQLSARIHAAIWNTTVSANTATSPAFADCEAL